MEGPRIPVYGFLSEEYGLHHGLCSQAASILVSTISLPRVWPGASTLSGSLFPSKSLGPLTASRSQAEVLYKIKERGYYGALATQTPLVQTLVSYLTGTNRMGPGWSTAVWERSELAS